MPLKSGRPSAVRGMFDASAAWAVSLTSAIAVKLNVTAAVRHSAVLNSFAIAVIFLIIVIVAEHFRPPKRLFFSALTEPERALISHELEGDCKS